MRIYLLISLTLWLATCGQKGPLYLPEKTTQSGVPQSTAVQAAELRG